MSEQARLQELRDYKILDTLPEKEFDDIVELAADLCNVQIAQITLVDANRQWIKSACGLLNQNTPRDLCFCSHALSTPDELLEIPDSLADERFSKNPLVVAPPGIRFYAGYPLTTAAGNVLGTLCVIDTQPRTLTDDQRRVLRILAKRVMRQLEMRKHIIQLQEELTFTVRRLDFLQDRMKQGGRINGLLQWDLNFLTNEIHLSRSCYELLAIKTSQKLSIKQLWGIVPSLERRRLLRIFISALQEKKSQYHIEHRISVPPDNDIWLETELTVLLNHAQEVDRISCRSRDITMKKQYTLLLEEMLFSVSHVLRRPVSSLQGLIHLLTKHEVLTQEVIQEYAKMFKKEIDELDLYTSKLTQIFLSKQENKFRTP